MAISILLGGWLVKEHLCGGEDSSLKIGVLTRQGISNVSRCFTSEHMGD